MKLIQLRGKYSNFYAKVDDEDYDFLMKWKWMYNKRGYVVRTCRTLKNGKRGHGAIIMHRLLTKPPENMEVDHINGDRLDNQKSNLRICTHKENAWNSFMGKLNKSGFKGVHFSKTGQKYTSQIKINGKTESLGLYDTARDAAIVYNLVAKIYRGKFAKLNKI